MNRKQKKMLARILTAAAMLIALKLIPVTGVLQLALYLVAYLVIGYDILKKAWRGDFEPSGVRRKLSDGRRPPSARSRWRSSRAAATMWKPSPSCCFIRSASCFRATPSARAAAISAR